MSRETAGGMRHDGGKDPWHLLPWDAVRPIVKVLAVGAKKYADRNWEKGLPYSRTYSATIRHLASWWGGETTDAESRLPHLAHAACGLLFLLAFEVRGRTDLDDRPRVNLAAAHTWPKGLETLRGQRPPRRQP